MSGEFRWFVCSHVVLLRRSCTEVTQIFDARACTHTHTQIYLSYILRTTLRVCNIGLLGASVCRKACVKGIICFLPFPKQSFLSF